MNKSLFFFFVFCYCFLFFLISFVVVVFVLFYFIFVLFFYILEVFVLCHCGCECERDRGSKKKGAKEKGGCSFLYSFCFDVSSVLFFSTQIYVFKYGWLVTCLPTLDKIYSLFIFFFPCFLLSCGYVETANLASVSCSSKTNLFFTNKKFDFWLFKDFTQ